MAGQPRTVLVTGGAGHLGRVLCEGLRVNGVAVRAPAGAAAYRSALDGVDVVVHLPAPGIAAPVVAAELARAAGVRRFVAVSSGRPGPELPRTRPSFETVAVRSAMVCGDSPGPLPGHLVHRMIRQAISSDTVTVSDPAACRPTVHIQDLVYVCQRLVLDPAGKVFDEPLPVGRENHPVGELARIVVDRVTRFLGRPIAIVRKSGPAIDSYHMSSRRLRTTLGFTPGRDVASACDEVIAAMLRTARSADRR